MSYIVGLHIGGTSIMLLKRLPELITHVKSSSGLKVSQLAAATGAITAVASHLAECIGNGRMIMTAYKVNQYVSGQLQIIQ